MERLTAIGRRKLDFTPKGQTEKVTGIQLFTTRSQENSADGQIAEKFFVNITADLYSSVLSLTFPCEIEASFNRYGKLEAFAVIKDEKKPA